MVKLTRIAPELPTANLQEALNEYQHMFGFQVALEMPEHGYAVVERDDVAIHLFEDNAHEHSPAAIHIFTAELDALQAEFRERGVRLSQEITRKPWGNRDFRLKDGFGNELKFTEPLNES